MAGYVSDAVIRRLPGYYRHLRELEAAGVVQISSQELGKRMHSKTNADNSIGRKKPLNPLLTSSPRNAKKQF